MVSLVAIFAVSRPILLYHNFICLSITYTDFLKINLLIRDTLINPGYFSPRPWVGTRKQSRGQPRPARARAVWGARSAPQAAKGSAPVRRQTEASGGRGAPGSRRSGRSRGQTPQRARSGAWSAERDIPQAIGGGGGGGRRHPADLIRSRRIIAH